MREFNQHPDRVNESSDRASSSQSQTHPARWRSLLFSCIRPETWEHGQTSSSESLISVEQRLQQQKQREQLKREKLSVIGRIEMIDDFQRNYITKLSKLEGKVRDLEKLVKKLEEHCNTQSNENNLSQLYDCFQDIDRNSLKQVQYINDKEENLTWMENMTDISQRDVQLPIYLQHHQRLKMLESQEPRKKNQLSEMNKQLEETKKQLKNIENNGYYQITELSQECMDQLSIMYQNIKDQDNIIQQRSNKIYTLEKEIGAERLEDHRRSVNYSMKYQAAVLEYDIFNMRINELEENNTKINHIELPLKQRIQCLSEMALKIDSAKSDTSEILQYIKLIESKKVNEWAEQNSQLDQHLNNISSRIQDLFGGQHPQVLLDAAKDLEIDLPRPKSSKWGGFKNWIYEDPEEIQEKFFKKDDPIIDGYVLMLEDMLINGGKNKRITDEQRKNEEYQKKYQSFAKLVVEVFKNFQNKGKRPAQSQELDQ